MKHNDNVATLRNFANKADSGRECAMGTASADDLASIHVELQDAVAIVHLTRPAKRNALNDETVFLLERWFSRPPEQVKAVVLVGDGDHFCAGLDLSELKERSVAEGVLHSRSWHRAFEPIEFGTLPVVAVLHGAVVGGGLELAAAAHIRVAEASTFYALPEGSRGIYVGGGASVRVPKLVGVARMMDMMLTGRTYGADEGYAIGLSQYVVPNGEGLNKGIEIAKKIAGNAPLTNFALVQALPRIAESGPAAGYLLEALMAGVAQGDPAAKARLSAFLEGRAAKVQHR
jgi:enoyl-CoA hydratase/carnithine racemase